MSMFCSMSQSSTDSIPLVTTVSISAAWSMTPCTITRTDPSMTATRTTSTMMAPSALGTWRVARASISGAARVPITMAMTSGTTSVDSAVAGPAQFRGHLLVHPRRRTTGAGAWPSRQWR